jgi:hypothetical protein
MEFSKWIINYSTNICQSGQGTPVLLSSIENENRVDDSKTFKRMKESSHQSIFDVSL